MSGAFDVSILMTVLNMDLYLAEAIESILEQRTTYSWQLLIVDDGSVDDSLRIACSYQARYPRFVRVLQHAGGRNRGISASRNLALRHADADLIAFLDSDDIWLPHLLETQITLLRSMPDVSFLYAAAERWVEFDQPFDELRARAAQWGANWIPPMLPPGQAAGLLPRGRLVEWFRQDESLVPCINTVVMHTAVARAVGGFCEQFRGLYDDQAFHAKVIREYDVFANDICVARYRQHADSCCRRSERDFPDAVRERNRFRSFIEQIDSPSCATT